MASVTAVAPPATDPAYRKQLDEAKPSAVASGTAALERADSAGTAAAQAAGPPLPPSSPGSSRRLCVILHGKRADQPDVRQVRQSCGVRPTGAIPCTVCQHWCRRGLWPLVSLRFVSGHPVRHWQRKP